MAAIKVKGVMQRVAVIDQNKAIAKPVRRRAGSQSAHTHRSHPPCCADARPRRPHVHLRKMCHSLMRPELRKETTKQNHKRVMRSGSWSLQTTGPNNGHQLGDYSKSSNRSEIATPHSRRENRIPLIYLEDIKKWRVDNLLPNPSIKRMNVVKNIA